MSGNILTAFNIVGHLRDERVKQSEAPGIIALAAAASGERHGGRRFLRSVTSAGKRIPDVLTSLGEQLVQRSEHALEELASLRDNLEHIRDTVAHAAEHAKLCGAVTETVAVPMLGRTACA